MPTQWCCLESKAWRNCLPLYTNCRVRRGANADAVVLFAKQGVAQLPTPLYKLQSEAWRKCRRSGVVCKAKSGAIAYPSIQIAE
jgi:hypothetical protein